LAAVALDVVDVFGEGADIEVVFGVIDGEALEEGVYGGKEGVVVAYDEVFAVLAGLVVI
jgi:hypothetical protein